jgi:hypothetical protein
MKGQYLQGSSCAGDLPSTYQPIDVTVCENGATATVTTSSTTTTTSSTPHVTTPRHNIVDEFLHQLLHNESLTVFPLCAWELSDWSLDSIHQLAVKTKETKMKSEIRLRETEHLKAKIGTPIQPGEVIIIDDTNPDNGEDILTTLIQSQDTTRTNGSYTTAATANNKNGSNNNNNIYYSSPVLQPHISNSLAVTLANRAELYLLSPPVSVQEKIAVARRFLLNELFVSVFLILSLFIFIYAYLYYIIYLN